MVKVRVLVRPSGCLNGRDWPEVGEVLELPAVVADGMVADGWLEVVKKVEKRPAARKGEETR